MFILLKKLHNILYIRVILIIISMFFTSCAYYFGANDNNRISFLIDENDPVIRKQFYEPKVPSIDTIREEKFSKLLNI